MFTIARTANGRPSLMHLVAENNWTACGIDINGWSRAYIKSAIPQILCKKCAKKITNVIPIATRVHQSVELLNIRSGTLR